MKTYRIITNGRRFRVEYKGWFGWRTVGYGDGYSWSPEEFGSFEAARDFISSKYIQQGPSEREKWTVV